jgi:inhibitor of KinA
MSLTPQFRDAGECALVVEFGHHIDEAVTAQVLALDAAMPVVPGLLETVPTYRSLMVHYDPLVVSRKTLVSLVKTALAQAALAPAAGQLWHLPACYDPALAPDLPHVAATTGLDPTQVSQLHMQATFRVVMYGFAPGWAYLSGLPAALALPRRATPRDEIPAGSLIIAGGLAIVAALPMPSGWHILGQTPVRLFAPDRNPAFLLAPGDRLRFDPVDLPSHHAFLARAAAGEALARKVRG